MLKWLEDSKIGSRIALLLVLPLLGIVTLSG